MGMPHFCDPHVHLEALIRCISMHAYWIHGHSRDCTSANALVSFPRAHLRYNALLLQIAFDVWSHGNVFFLIGPSSTGQRDTAPGRVRRSATRRCANFLSQTEPTSRPVE